MTPYQAELERNRTYGPIMHVWNWDYFKDVLS